MYMLTNKVTKKKYIGKSENLFSRLNNYFSEGNLKSNLPSRINKAILKFGHSNFSLTILEICDKSVLSSREQFYIDTLKPQLNIRKAVAKTFKSKSAENKTEK
ncbi:GIY-YIG nuclease family protein [Pseudonocardia nematodicida]|uniref:GIY-YIG nuclease family protein n=1 Tax=Pseudonocardia nematodicida TaxID=1206997 RepID=UPI00360AE161